MNQKTRTHFLYRSVLIAFLSTVIGNLIFALIEDLKIMYQFGLENSMFALIFSVGFTLTIIPSILSGFLLAQSIYGDFNKGALKISKAILKGSSIGLLVACGGSIIILILINSRGLLDLFLLRVFDAVLIAIVCGGCAGLYLAKYLIKK